MIARALAGIAGMALLASVIPACSSDTASTPAPDGGAGDDGGGGPGEGGDLPCPPSGVSKGPWSIAMSRTGGRVRWEACRADAAGGLALRPEAGGPEVFVASTTSTRTLAIRHRAVLNPERSPDDAPGTFVVHESALANLTPGTCYRYALVADRALGGRFCTAQPDGGKVHFLAIGDTNPMLGEATGKVLGHVLPKSADFVVHGGDIQYYDSHLETWAGWFPAMQPLLALGSLQPALGNHEKETDDELQDYSLRFFGYPQLGGETMWYRFESGGVYFHVLDTEAPVGPGTPQGQWLTASLGDASQKAGFRASIVVMHRPFVTCGDNGQLDTERRAFASTFAQLRVPLVIQAHIHGYERFEIDGVTFVTTGGGGGLLGKMDENVSRAECAQRKVSGGFFHAVDFVVEGKEIRGAVVDDAASVRDSFAIPLPWAP